MWFKNSIVVLSSSWLCFFAMLHWYRNQMMSSDMDIVIDEALWFLSLQSSFALMPPLFFLLFFTYYKPSKSLHIPMFLIFLGGILGVVLHIIIYTKNIFLFEEAQQTKPSLVLSQLQLMEWSLGGSLSGLFLGIVIDATLQIFEDDSLS